MRTISFKKILKDWMLVVGMAAGIGLYFVYREIPALHPAGPFLLSACKLTQPVFLFSMLFLSFCKIEPQEMKLRKWHLWLLLVQLGSFVALTGMELLAIHGDSPTAVWIMDHRIAYESILICIICPTATACAVVTAKLGGSMADVVTYTVIINLVVAIAVPVAVPLLYPASGISFWQAFFKILAKVFPLLIMPCLCAWGVRYFFPKLHARLTGYVYLSFYIWIVALTIAVMLTTRAIANHAEDMAVLLEMAIASGVSCFLQFLIGKRIGRRYDSSISAGQALAQKNNIFGMWMAYTFLTPLTSVACGLYLLWQNTFNSWQIYRHNK